MKLINTTNYSAAIFRQFDLDGQLDCVVAARGTFLVGQNSRLSVADVQEPFQWTDEYEGNPQDGALIRQTDLVPYKPGTDVTFLGDSINPRPNSSLAWLCRIKVGDRVDKALRVMGTREWTAKTRKTWRGLFQRDPKPMLLGWELSTPSSTERVPISWSQAYGGVIPSLDMKAPDVHPDNPFGKGMVDIDHCDYRRSYPAPSIEEEDNPINEWSQEIEPACFAPIPPWCRQRQQFAGTYDRYWMENRHPILPQDFDTRFWQCASDGLIAIPWLDGTEQFTLENLHPAEAELKGELPGITLRVGIQFGSSETHRVMVLDGLHFDFRFGRALALLTWRVRFPLPDPDEATVTLIEAQTA